MHVIGSRVRTINLDNEKNNNILGLEEEYANSFLKSEKLWYQEGNLARMLDVNILGERKMRRRKLALKMTADFPPHTDVLMIFNDYVLNQYKVNSTVQNMLLF